jgi:hypothetical protein
MLKTKNPTVKWGSRLNQFHRVDLVSLLELVNDIKTFNNLPKTGMVTIQVLSVLSVVTDKEL